VPTFIFCGQVINHSIIAQNDLVDCEWDGLVVGAPNITIDLNGHTVDGKAKAAGIRNDGHDWVTIRNGVVRDFEQGVMLLSPGTKFNTVELIEASSNKEAGISLGHAPHPLSILIPPVEDPPPTFQSGVDSNRIRNNTLVANAGVGLWLTNAARYNDLHNNAIGSNSSDGIWVERAHENIVRENEIFNSSGPAVALEGANGNTVRDNLFAENDMGVSIDVTRVLVYGIPSNDNVIQGNTLTENGGDGFWIFNSEGNQILDNVAPDGGGSGVELDQARDTLIKGNNLRGNLSGVSAKQSTGNRIEGNDTRDRRQHVEPQRWRRYLRRRRDARRERHPHPGQPHPQQRGLGHPRLEGEPRPPGQHRQRQRRMGHLGERRQQRHLQHRCRRQPRPGQHGPAGPAHAEVPAVLQHCL
jgi:parallel beta-helix repeat protein